MLHNDKGLVLTTYRTIEPLFAQIKAMKRIRARVFLPRLKLQNEQQKSAGITGRGRGKLVC